MQSIKITFSIAAIASAALAQPFAAANYEAIPAPPFTYYTGPVPSDVAPVTTVVYKTEPVPTAPVPPVPSAPEVTSVSVPDNYHAVPVPTYVASSSVEGVSSSAIEYSSVPVSSEVYPTVPVS
ncbi:hypothetical protein H4R21_006105, partial [Coemansia helicoidea]